MIPPGFGWHAALLQEPWCLTPDQVARLDERQVKHLYVLPAVRKAKREKGDATGPELTAAQQRQAFADALLALRPSLTPVEVERCWQESLKESE